MPRLIPQPREKIIRAITKAYGWRSEREGAKHTVFTHPLHPEVIALPRHKEISPGVQRNVCRILGITTAQFLETLRNC